MTMFKKASKQLAKVKIAVTGPSGSGKTYSSLLLAKGLGGRVAVIDTENNSACLYADSFPGWSYDVVTIQPPFTVQKYIAAIDGALKENYDVLVIDSLSHVWAGEGGLLAQKEALDSRGGNSYTNWASITKLHEQFKGKILQSPITVIATMRSKQEYIMEANEKGKQAPKKVGLAPIQRENMEYEFSVVFDIAMDHRFVVSKDRTGLFDGVVDFMSEKTGEALNGWLATADRTVITAADIKADHDRVQKVLQQLPGIPTPTHTFVPPLKVETAGKLQQPSIGIVKGGGPAGEYLIKFGLNTGKKLKDSDPAKLVAYRDQTIAWQKANPSAETKDEVRELLAKIDQFFSYTEPPIPPPFDDAEQIPDFGVPIPGVDYESHEQGSFPEQSV